MIYALIHNSKLAVVKIVIFVYWGPPYYSLAHISFFNIMVVKGILVQLGETVILVMTQCLLSYRLVSYPTG